MKKLLYILLLTLCAAGTTVAQKVTDNKGTFITVDTSKWKLSGVDIYNKNSGNIGIGIITPVYKLDVSAASNPLRLQGLQSGLTTDSALTVLNGVVRRVQIIDSSIYKQDGLLAANRNIFMVNKTLAFDTSTLFINPTTNNIGIGTISPNAAAALDVTSTIGGVLLPRISSTQRTAIASPVNGLLVYDITTNCFWVYKSSLWVQLISGAPTMNTNNAGAAYTSATYTLQTSDNGSILEFNNATGVTVSIPTGLPAGFQCSITQLGVGQITFAGLGVTLRNAYNYTKTATQYSKAGVEITSTTTVAILSGDMQ